VFVGMQSPAAHVVLAQIQEQGLREALQVELAKLGTAQADVEIYDPQTLPASNTAVAHHGPVFLITPSMLIAGDDINSVRRVSNQLGQDSGFESTPFGQRIQQVYSHGAGILVAADLKALQAHNSPQGARAASASGFADADYLVAEHRESNGQPENRAVLAFSNTRRGIASWLAAPTTMGSLNFVSSEASAALAMVVKSPAQMLQDVQAIERLTRSERRTSHTHQGPPKEIVDLAAGFGNDFTVALDGPVLPTPSWKLVAEVYDSSRVQYGMQELVTVFNEHEAKEGKPALKITSTSSNGQTYYAIVGGPTEVHYTFDNGYMIMGPNNAVLAKALQIRSNASTSLAASGQFRSLLPQDSRIDYSAVLYQNLAPVLQPLASYVTASQLQSLQRIAADSRPTVVAAWGEQDRIEVLSNSKFVVDLNTLTLGALLGAPDNPGTRR
jgi:hypothetical protein